VNKTVFTSMYLTNSGQLLNFCSRALLYTLSIYTRSLLLTKYGNHTLELQSHLQGCQIPLLFVNPKFLWKREHPNPNFPNFYPDSTTSINQLPVAYHQQLQHYVLCSVSACTQCTVVHFVT